MSVDRRSVVTGGAIVLALVTCLFLPDVLAPLSAAMVSSAPKVHVATATFAALCVQALPVILVGAAISGVVAVVMTPYRWARIIPRNRVLGIVVAAGFGMVMPTCECASVPLARRMMSSGVGPSAAITFMVAAPSLNPLVLWSTFVAFGGVDMAFTRFVAGFCACVLVGVVVAVAGGHRFDDLVRGDGRDEHQDHLGVLQRWFEAARHDALGAATFLVVGGALAAIGSAFVPASAAASISENVLVSILVMSAVAVVASLCSLGDAFVAASLVELSPAAMLAFMVVGPIVDLKLAAMMEGILGSRATQFIVGVGITAGIVSTVVIAYMQGWV